LLFEVGLETDIKRLAPHEHRHHGTGPGRFAV
jgi:hypothetical protein